MRKLMKIVLPIAITSLMLGFALAFPIILEKTNVDAVPKIGQYNGTDIWLIQPTYAQSSTTELATAIGDFLDTVITGWETYVVLGLIVSFAVFLFVRFIRGAKSS